jgi:hypothetical protein
MCGVALNLLGYSKLNSALSLSSQTSFLWGNICQIYYNRTYVVLVVNGIFPFTYLYHLSEHRNKQLSQGEFN